MPPSRTATQASGLTAATPPSWAATPEHTSPQVLPPSRETLSIVKFCCGSLKTPRRASPAASRFDGAPEAPTSTVSHLWPLSVLLQRKLVPDLKVPDRNTVPSGRKTMSLTDAISPGSWKVLSMSHLTSAHVLPPSVLRYRM
ncbi:hypothetical protein [Moorella sp. E308F]|uniref:hypothetical protein n=1 Tax=Moorella sp. E308F TaxID=2572682 RepID=UPI001143C132|nr:hypothetical protein [Moorella sp. E308F]